MDVKFCAADEDGKGSELKGRRFVFATQPMSTVPMPDNSIKVMEQLHNHVHVIFSLQHGAIITLLIKNASVNLQSFYFLLIFTLHSFAPSVSCVGAKQSGNWNSLKKSIFRLLVANVTRISQSEPVRVQILI